MKSRTALPESKWNQCGYNVCSRIGFLSLVTSQFRKSALANNVLSTPSTQTECLHGCPYRQIGMAMIMCSTWTRMMERIFRATWMRAKARSLEYRERRGRFVLVSSSLSLSVSRWKLSSLSLSLSLLSWIIYICISHFLVFLLTLSLPFFYRVPIRMVSVQACHFLSYEIPTRSWFIC